MASVRYVAAGCCLACAAMLANLSYAEAAKIAGQIGIHAGDQPLCRSTEPMRRVLAKLGINAADSELPFEVWSKLPDRCLLAIKWHIEHGIRHWHWVVYSRNGPESAVLDPAAYLETNRRTDFARMQTMWFLEIV